MKNLVLMLGTVLISEGAVNAQSSSTSPLAIITFAGVPSGSCAPSQLAVNLGNGAIYYCSASSWTIVPQGSSSGAANTIQIGNGSGGFTAALCSIDNSGNLSCPATITSGGVLATSCATDSGCVGPFAGANYWGWDLPATLTNPLHLIAPDAQPTITNSVMLFGATASNKSSFTFGPITPSIVPTANIHGTGTRFQTSDNTGTNGNCVKFDANGNVTDAGAPCGTSSGGGGSFQSTFTCTSTPTTVTAATHGQGTHPQWRGIDATDGVTLVRFAGVTLASNGDMTFACTLSESVTVTFSAVKGVNPNYFLTFTGQTSLSVPQYQHGLETPYQRAQFYDTATPRNAIQAKLSTDLNSFDDTLTFSLAQDGLVIIAPR